MFEDAVTVFLAIAVALLWVRWYRSASERRIFEQAQLTTIKSYMEAHLQFLEQHGERQATLEYRITRIEARIRTLQKQRDPSYDADAAAEQV